MMTGSSVNAIRLPNTSVCCPQIGTTLKSNSRIPLNKRICKREPSFQVGSLSCIRSIQFSRYIPPISFQIFFFFQCSLALLAWGRNSCVRFAFFSMSRLSKHSCAVTAQHLLLQMHSISITPECYSGAFSRKSTFLKIGFLFIFSLPSPILPTDEREKTDRTTAQLSVTKKCCLLRFPLCFPTIC